MDDRTPHFGGSAGQRQVSLKGRCRIHHNAVRREKRRVISKVLEDEVGAVQAHSVDPRRKGAYR